MRKQPEKRDKLVPLRRFSDKKLYSTTYLSVLVQRKKLKAEKVGRIYYTTEKWFESYLDKHAREEVREAYLSKKLEVRSKKKNVTTLYKSGFFIGLNNNWFKAAGLAVAVLILAALLVNSFIMYDSKQGRVSGVSEQSFETGTSSEAVSFD